MNKVLEFLNKEILDNSTVVVACSGGPDSMCLLSILNDIKVPKNLKLVVAHVNHKVRIESDEEESYCANYARCNGDFFEVIHLDEFKDGKFSEDLARRKRYKFFDEIMSIHNAKYLLTAHHGDDLIETILMRITRGSNLKGYMGIRPISKKDNYTILRPLLYISKDDILKYNEDNKIKFFVDKTNKDLKYTRNRYRDIVLPFLKEEDKNVIQKYIKYSNELSEYNDFVNEYIDKNNFVVDNFLDINKVKDEKTFIIKKCIEKMIRNIQDKDYFDISDNQIREILKLIDSDNKGIDLNNNHQAIKEYNYLKIIEKKNSLDYRVEFKDYFENDEYIITSVTNSDNDNNFVIRLNSEEFLLPLIIRNVIDGDKMTIKNMIGHKKIKDIFTDEKILPSKRGEYPVVTDSCGEILWLPGLKKSKFSKDKSEKYDIILNCEVKNHECKTKSKQ